MVYNAYMHKLTMRFKNVFAAFYQKVAIYCDRTVPYVLFKVYRRRLFFPIFLTAYGCRIGGTFEAIHKSNQFIVYDVKCYSDRTCDTDGRKWWSQWAMCSEYGGWGRTFQLCFMLENNFVVSKAKLLWWIWRYFCEWSFFCNWNLFWGQEQILRMNV